ncbi:hypothetical protein FGO68_gene5843 [Halteria grandinella]|uniref:Uncharacterized protein n=1 Tax=Halteria grandinella TaxID=5974 RepID=A0A8J8NVN7_HALGN|nr:hypothetical protein FGO68_gene5843 [Halteria grandinella]
MNGDQLSLIQSFFQVTGTLTIDAQFLQCQLIEKQLNEFKCKEIIIETLSLKCKKLKEFFSKQYIFKVFIKCSNLKISGQVDIDWAFNFMKKKQLNQLWEISPGQFAHKNYKNLEIIFKGQLSNCNWKRISILGLDFKIGKTSADRATEELHICSAQTIRMANFALQNCQNLIKLKLDLKIQSYIYPIEIKSSRLKEIEINNCSKDYRFVGQLLAKSKNTLRSLSLHQCKNINLLPLKEAILIYHIAIIKCELLQNLNVITTLKSLGHLESDEENIIKFGKKIISQLNKLTLNLSQLSSKAKYQQFDGAIYNIYYY